MFFSTIFACANENILNKIKERLSDKIASLVIFPMGVIFLLCKSYIVTVAIDDLDYLLNSANGSLAGE